MARNAQLAARMQKHATWSVALLALAAGCGGKADDGSTGDGGASDGAACTRTFDRAPMGITQAGQRIGCPGDIPAEPLDGGGGKPSLDPITIAVTGAVTGATATTLTLDTCPPNADCIANPVTLDVTAPGLALDAVVPKGAFVHVTLVAQRFFACQASVIVASIASWGGETNPAGTGDGLLFAAIDGGAATPAGAPYVAEPIALGCVADAGPTCGGTQYAVDDYAWRFTDVASGVTTDVAMGATVDLTIAGHPHHARDLRSFQTSNCDDYWNWAYWIARDP